MISSSSNPRIKYFRLLSTKKGRVKENKFVVEGPHLILSALDNNAEIECALYSRDFADNKHSREILDRIESSKLFEVDEKTMGSLSEVENCQGIIATVKVKTFSLDDIIKGQNPIILFCEGIQDPGNLGAIVRTADAAGLSGVILSNGTVDIFNTKTIRATMGSIFNLPYIYADDSVLMIEKLKEKCFFVIAASLAGKTDHYRVDFGKKTVIVIGGEESGIPERIVAASDMVVKIPILGKAESLNASAAAAIIIYEAVRQRRI